MSLIIDNVSDSVSWFCARRFCSSCRVKPTLFGIMVLLPQSEIVGFVWYSRTAPPRDPDIVASSTDIHTSRLKPMRSEDIPSSTILSNRSRQLGLWRFETVADPRVSANEL